MVLVHTLIFLYPCAAAFLNWLNETLSYDSGMNHNVRLILLLYQIFRKSLIASLQ